MTEKQKELTRKAIDRIAELRYKYLTESKQIPPMTLEEYKAKCEAK